MKFTHLKRTPPRFARVHRGASPPPGCDCGTRRSAVPLHPQQQRLAGAKPRSVPVPSPRSARSCKCSHTRRGLSRLKFTRVVTLLDTMPLHGHPTRCASRPPLMDLGGVTCGLSGTVPLCTCVHCLGVHLCLQCWWGDGRVVTRGVTFGGTGKPRIKGLCHCYSHQQCVRVPTFHIVTNACLACLLGGSHLSGVIVFP